MRPQQCLSVGCVFVDVRKNIPLFHVACCSFLGQNFRANAYMHMNETASETPGEPLLRPCWRMLCVPEDHGEKSGSLVPDTLPAATYSMDEARVSHAGIFPGTGSSHFFKNCQA